MNLKLTIILFITFLSFTWAEDCCEAADIATENCGGLGCYIPQCTEDCEWEPMQCWSSTGYCWCVNEDGEEIEGTSMPSWQGLPDCEEFSSSLAGDVNGDEEINVLDVVIIIGFILGSDTPTDAESLAADYNDDGEINVLDVVSIIDLIINPNEDESPEECYLEPDPGPCFGYVLMYYFNQDAQACQTFVWGGCGGVVPFQTLSECQNACE
tara:strand:+ start:1597 stop:2229 length:633 start_codon:yes stop_codon:yes gene_type:complete